MITIELLERIEQLLPGRDDDSALRRRVVRILADAGGQLSLDALHVALGPGGRVALALVASWDGLYWSTPRMVRLAPWVRRKLGLPVQEEGPCASLPPGFEAVEVEGDWALAEACWGRVCLVP
jgi:hypothetical protein